MEALGHHIPTSLTTMPTACSMRSAFSNLYRWKFWRGNLKSQDKSLYVGRKRAQNNDLELKTFIPVPKH